MMSGSLSSRVRSVAAGFAVAALSLTTVSTAAFTVPVSAQELTEPTSTPPEGGVEETIPPAAAEPAIEFASLSPWVDAEGTFEAVFELTGFAPDASVTYEIHQSVSGDETERRDTLEDLRTNPDAPAGPILHGRRSVALADITVGSTSTLSIPIRSTSGRNRRALYIPDAGTYPIDVSITDSAGAELRQRLYLNRLPASNVEQAAPVRLVPVIDLNQSAGTLDDGSLDELELSSLRSTYRRVASLIDSADTLPITASLSPESIGALERSDNDALSEISDALDGQQTLGSTWADVDLESLATSGSYRSFERSLADGNETLQVRQLTPIDSSAWGPDPTLGPRSLSWLDRVGVATVLLKPDQIATDTIDNDDDDAGDIEQLSYSQRVTVTGDRFTIGGLIADPDLDSLASGTTDDPVIAAHQMLTLLAAQRQVDQRARGALFVIDDQVRDDVANALFDALNAAMAAPSALPAVVVVAPAALADVDLATTTKNAPLQVSLEPRSTLVDLSDLDQAYNSARTLIDDYAALVGATDPETMRLATIVHRSLDRRIDASDQSGLLDDTISTIEAAFDGITLPRPRALNVTERRTTIPLRITNGLDRTVEVSLRLKSSRLKFLDGEVQTLTLQPGTNRIELRVEAQASGQFAMQAEVLVPRSNRVLASTRQTIRSTAFSGVGLILSGGAVAFLVLWWLRTPRRRDDDDSDTGDGSPELIGETESDTKPVVADG